MMSVIMSPHAYAVTTFAAGTPSLFPASMMYGASMAHLDPPEGTKSFALTCFDPDAPTGSGFWHWVVVNIPPDVTELPLDAGNQRSGKLPDGALQVRNDVGTREYVGPCPPQGDHPHRYLFTVFAVGVDQLPVNADTSAAVVGFNLHFNTLAKAELMGLFKH